MRAIHGVSLSLFVLIQLSPEVAAQSRPILHEQWLENAELTHADFSRDGTRVVAAWYAPARNRPGTDWMTGVAVWDLETGSAGALSDATGPVAFSPNGEQVLAAKYEHSSDRRYRMQPIVTGPALWSFDGLVLQTEFRTPPQNFLPFPSARPSGGPPFLAAAFDPQGDHIVACTQYGALLTWAVDRTNDVICGDVLHFESGNRGWGQVPGRGMLRFDSRNSLSLLRIERRSVGVVNWRVDLAAGRFERIDAREYEAFAPDQQSGAEITFHWKETGQTMIGTDHVGNQIVYDIQRSRVDPEFVRPDGDVRLALGENGQFLLLNAETGSPVYRLLPGQPAEKLEPAE